MIDKITCPECDEVFEHHDLKKHMTDEEFARYERLKLRATLNAIPDFRWCIAPNCDNGQIHDVEGGTIFTCNSCKYKSCTTCEREFHDGETCEQYTERMAAQDDLNKASEATINAMAKECPKCRSKIEKNGGCDHMTCKSFKKAQIVIERVDFLETLQKNLPRMEHPRSRFPHTEY
jgi:hypothetical protein